MTCEFGAHTQPHLGSSLCRVGQTLPSCTSLFDHGRPCRLLGGAYGPLGGLLREYSASSWWKRIRGRRKACRGINGVKSFAPRRVDIIWESKVEFSHKQAPRRLELPRRENPLAHSTSIELYPGCNAFGVSWLPWMLDGRRSRVDRSGIYPWARVVYKST